MFSRTLESTKPTVNSAIAKTFSRSIHLSTWFFARIGLPNSDRVSQNPGRSIHLRAGKVRVNGRRSNANQPTNIVTAT